ncbi:MAG: GNAT family N-acetyltransferase [Pseudomonadota bacterium]
MSDSSNSASEQAQHATRVREAYWPEDAETLRRLRELVFIEEQQVPRDIEWDGQDEGAVHVMAHQDGTAIGCGRLLADGRIGRLAVLGDYRGQGLGAKLLGAILKLARGRGDLCVYLHAQTHALKFYENAGFSAVGDEFVEAGIPHRHMELMLDYRDCNELVYPVRYPQPFSQLIIAQARHARRELRILSPRLDPVAFDQAELLSAIRLLLQRGRMSRVYILVQDAQGLVTRGHGILELARRLTTGIDMRELREHPQWDGDTAVIRDRDSLLTKPTGEQATAFYRPDDRARTRTALTRFDELWSAGHVSPEFRSFSL